MAATGFGKTLTFFMPLIFVEEGVVIIVTTLNILGTQIVKQLFEVNIGAVVINAETYNPNELRVITFNNSLTFSLKYFTENQNWLL